MRAIIIALLLTVTSTAQAGGYCGYRSYYRPYYGYSYPYQGYYPSTPYINPYSNDADAILAQAVRDRSNWEGYHRAQATKAAAFIEKLKASGLNQGWSNFGLAGDLAASYFRGYTPYEKQFTETYGQPPTAQGNSIYGTNEVATITGDVDADAVNQLLGGILNNHDNRNADLLQAFSSHARATSAEKLANIKADAEGKARVAEIQAKAQSLLAFGQAIRPEGRITYEKNTASSKPAEQPEAPPEQPRVFGKGLFRVDRESLSFRKCGECHEKKNKPQIGYGMDPDLALEALRRIRLAPAAEGHMPDGSTLTGQERSDLEDEWLGLNAESEK